MLSKAKVAPVQRQAASGIAWGKFILCGEHSVVYGYPAIAIPLTDLTLTAQANFIANQPDQFSSQLFQGFLSAMPSPLAGLQKAVETALLLLRQQVNYLRRPINLLVSGKLPYSRGMGSSAAVVNACLKALFALFEQPIASSQLFNLTQLAEKITHGNPSGLDAMATTISQPIYFHQGRTRPLTIRTHAFFVLADSGLKGHTEQVVTAVKQQYQANWHIRTTIQTLGQLTNHMVDLLANDQMRSLGQFLTQAHGHLRNIGVSNLALDRLVDVALAAGALGAKLTGGGHGGCMLALCDNPTTATQVAQALLTAGAQQTWLYQLKDTKE